MYASGVARSPFDGGVVLVTGASSGIGEALARQLAPRAKALVLVARRKERLDALARDLEAAHGARGLAAHVYACDVTDFAAVDRMLADVEAKIGAVDVLVNNAGFGDLGTFDHADWDKTRRMIDLNVTSLTYLTHRLVRPMVARGHGGILNVSSGFGLTFMPGFAAYLATKHYVTSFTEALRLDLQGTGVVVSQVCPGPVRTEFNDTLGNFTGRDAPKFVEISAEHAARAAIRGIDRRRALVIPGLAISFLMALAAVTPRWVLRLVYAPVATLLRKRQEKELAKGIRS